MALPKIKAARHDKMHTPEYCPDRNFILERSYEGSLAVMGKVSLLPSLS
jgi:hypothetical protein